MAGGRAVVGTASTRTACERRYLPRGGERPPAALMVLAIVLLLTRQVNGCAGSWPADLSARTSTARVCYRRAAGIGHHWDPAG